jgi:hypothetical protein
MTRADLGNLSSPAFGRGPGGGGPSGDAGNRSIELELHASF